MGASPTRQPLQPEAIGAVMELTKWLKPSIRVRAEHFLGLTAPGGLARFSRGLRPEEAPHAREPR